MEAVIVTKTTYSECNTGKCNGLMVGMNTMGATGELGKDGVVVTER